jgi:predicted amidohydrolase
VSSRSEPGACFDSVYSHGFVRAAVCIPAVRVAVPRLNAEHTVTLARRASALKAVLALFPELGLSAYSNEDLFHQDPLLDAVRNRCGRTGGNPVPFTRLRRTIPNVLAMCATGHALFWRRRSVFCGGVPEPVVVWC